ncbi:hypothetical protein LJC31_01220 [Synergistaceae bacterium OttesenSCG-928-I11]|nr:hypothetical protein [Synergistaceae bacterium OttesenSCG-928-I11]
MSFQVYGKIGSTGYSMIHASTRRMDELVEGMDKDDPKSVAKANVEITKQKARMHQGMSLVKSYEDLMNSTLVLFGIGCRCNCKC